jgi:hypothetical protein
MYVPSKPNQAHNAATDSKERGTAPPFVTCVQADWPRKGGCNVAVTTTLTLPHRKPEPGTSSIYTSFGFRARRKNGGIYIQRGNKVRQVAIEFEVKSGWTSLFLLQLSGEFKANSSNLSLGAES